RSRAPAPTRRHPLPLHDALPIYRELTHPAHHGAPVTPLIWGVAGASLLCLVTDCRCKRLRLHLCSSGAAWRLVTSGIGMFRVVEGVGVRVVEVEGLHDVACMVDGEEVALVRAGLTPDLRDRVVDWLLHEALGSGRASCA